MARHHQREKRFGPSPRNNYTSGSGRRRGLFGWGRRRQDDTGLPDPNQLPEHTLPSAVRDSYVSGATTTVAGADGIPMEPYHKTSLDLDPRIQSESYHHLIQDQESAHYPPANYRYDDGVYPARHV